MTELQLYVVAVKWPVTNADSRGMCDGTVGVIRPTVDRQAILVLGERIHVAVSLANVRMLAASANAALAEYERLAGSLNYDPMTDTLDDGLAC